MDEQLRRLKRIASLGGSEGQQAYIAALERAVGGVGEVERLPKNLTVRDRQILERLSAYNCTTAIQLAGIMGFSRRGVKERLDNLYKMKVLDRRMGLRGGYVYWIR